MKPKTYVILTETIENAIPLGYRRAFKHDENPCKDYMFSCIHEAIIQAIFERFTFDEDE
jgi:hypothetical protein